MSRLLPVLFLSHGGGPGFLLKSTGSLFEDIDVNSLSAKFMRSLNQEVIKKATNEEIKCILVVTAHWEESEFTVYSTDNGKSELLYDYYGFPKESYAPYLTYPVETDIGTADLVCNLLHQNGIPCRKNNKRGFDHGTFIPLKTSFPEANIPVVQISLKNDLDIASHIRLGEILGTLRNQGVLIVCSGQATHNLQEIRQVKSTKPFVDTRTIEFTEWLRNLFESTTSENYQESKNKLIEISKLAPHFNWCHPRTEHFIPICVAFGAFLAFSKKDVCGDNKDNNNDAEHAQTIQRIFTQTVLGSMSLDSYMIF
jgi:aromatic ring-opening dioxygenase catalytic subunit (LigB family)